MKYAHFLVLLWVAVLFNGCALSECTHHSSISVQFKEANLMVDKKVVDIAVRNKTAIDALVQSVDKWASESGFVRAGNGHHQQWWYTTAANGDEITIYYEEKLPSNPKLPVEIMVYCDPDGSPLFIRISSSESFGTAPSTRLTQAYTELLCRLKKQFGPDNPFGAIRVDGSIW